MGLRRLDLALKFGNDLLSQLFTQLNPILVETVDGPNRTLRERNVLIEGDEFAEDFRRQLLGENRVRWAVALEYPMWNKLVLYPLGLGFLGRLTEGQRLALGENVCQKNVVVSAIRVQRSAERDKVAGNKSRSLMDQLVEGVLTVGAWLAEIDRTGLIGN